MSQYNVGAPSERVAIDVLGPLPESGSGRYLLTTFQSGQKPIHCQTKRLEVLVKDYICRFVVPTELHSNQGRVFTEMCTILGIKKTRTTPLHPQSDGMVERMNRTLEAQLSKIVNEHQCDWDQYVPF